MASRKRTNHRRNKHSKNSFTTPKQKIKEKQAGFTKSKYVKWGMAVLGIIGIGTTAYKFGFFTNIPATQRSTFDNDLGLEQYYYIDTNVANIQSAEFIFFGENHDNTTQDEWQNKFIRALGVPGDYVLIESMPFEGTCHPKIATRFEPEHYTTSNYQFQFICRGWEDWPTRLRVEELVIERTSKIAEIEAAIQETTEKQQQYARALKAPEKLQAGEPVEKS